MAAKYMNNSIPGGLVSWLSDAGSFMQRLKRYGIENAQVRVLREGWSLPAIAEQVALDLPSNTSVWVREVVIHSDKTIWMFARTVIPKKTLDDEELQLQNLRNRSLGSVLFAYPDLVRGEFDYFGVESGTDLYEKIQLDVPMCVTDLKWARSSVFTLRNKSLLLTEVFSNAIMKL